MKYPLITVCILTYKRNRLLKCLLDELITSEASDRWNVVIVDTSGESCAQTLVPEYEGVKAGLIEPFYSQERMSISVARNKALDLAQGEWVFFLDDDQIMAGEAIERLIDKLEGEVASGVDFKAALVSMEFKMEKNSGEEVVDGFLAKKLKSSRWFTDGRRSADRVESYHMGTGGALFKKPPESMRFNEQLGFTGGEDNDFFYRYLGDMSCPIWSGFGLIEQLAADRVNLSYLMRASYRKGNCYAGLEYGLLKKSKFWIFVNSIKGLFLSVLYFFYTVVFWKDWGRAISLICRQFGKMSGLIGVKYEIYKDNTSNH